MADNVIDIPKVDGVWGRAFDCIRNKERWDAESKNLPGKIMYKCSDGVHVEADKAVMVYSSAVTKDLIETTESENGVVTTIPVPFPSANIEAVVRLCKEFYRWVSESRRLRAWGNSWPSRGGNFPLYNAPTIDVPPQASRKTPDELNFDEDIFWAGAVKRLAAYNWEEIMRLHGVAKYLDIKFLQELTETLIINAPSREFLERVSPWVDYNSLNAYRSQHVEACRNLEVAAY